VTHGNETFFDPGACGRINVSIAVAENLQTIEEIEAVFADIG
jgi:hypothetical protein